MTENLESLVLKQLGAICTEIAAVKDGTREIKARLAVVVETLTSRP